MFAVSFTCNNYYGENVFFTSVITNLAFWSVRELHTCKSILLAIPKKLFTSICYAGEDCLTKPNEKDSLHLLYNQNIVALHFNAV